jgi:hypothetical protein
VSRLQVALNILIAIRYLVQWSVCFFPYVSFVLLLPSLFSLLLVFVSSSHLPALSFGSPPLINREGTEEKKEERVIKAMKKLCSMTKFTAVLSSVRSAAVGLKEAGLGEVIQGKETSVAVLFAPFLLLSFSLLS